MSEIEATLRGAQNYMIETHVKYLELQRKIEEIEKALEVLTRGVFMVVPDSDTQLNWAIEVDKLFEKWGWE